MRMSLMPSIMSSSSMLFYSISFLISFKSPISFYSSCFCSLRNSRLLWISHFCYSLKFKASLNSTNHSSSSCWSLPKRCLPSAADHIMYLCNAGRLRLTICLKYSLMVLILSRPVAPILYRKLSMMPFSSYEGSSPALACSNNP